MQKLMSFVLSATMFTYMACGETIQKNADTAPKENVHSDTSENQTQETESSLLLPEEN